jgi:hypothetical protein
VHSYACTDVRNVRVCMNVITEKEGQMNRHKKYRAVVLYKSKNGIKHVISSTYVKDMNYQT